MDASSRALRLGSVIVFVEDPAAAAALYERAFGLSADFVTPENDFAQLDAGAIKLSFCPYRFPEANFGGVRHPDLDGPPPNVELAFAVEADEIDAAHERAVAAGCEALTAPFDQAHGSRVSFLRDPFGTLVELIAPLRS